MVLQLLPEGLLHELEVEKVAAVGLVVLQVNLVVKLGETFELDGIECSFNHAAGRDDLLLFEELESLELVGNYLLIDSQHDMWLSKHVRRKQMSPAFFLHSDLQP